MKRSLTQRDATLLNSIFTNLYSAYRDLEEIRPAGGFEELVEKPKDELIEVVVTENQIGTMVMWIGTKTFTGKTVGVNSRKATLKFHD